MRRVASRRTLSFEPSDPDSNCSSNVTITVGDLTGDRNPGFTWPTTAGIFRERDRVFESDYSSTSDETGFGLSIEEEVAAGRNWIVTVTDGDGE
ncbi:hypothetical protein [Natrinema caseinilyticum]|uniref:hypothetical protein n=1 Tax=Natrinema caseinilyticum TaxID=2961570 RepID=UPI0020C357C7|nr:hypothetical protein [Natrinema caseinilyticum]